MKVLSIQVGLPKTVNYRGREISTGIFKSPIDSPVMVRRTNIEGDGQADLQVHGGIDKAVYAYPFDAYSAWSAKRPDEALTFGAFGENLTMDQILENEIYIGDTFKLGSTILEAAQPRLPCYKLGVKFNDPSVIKLFMRFGRPGVYFRVLQEGTIQNGDELTLLSREQTDVSIQRLFFVLRGDAVDASEIARILSLSSLPDDLRSYFN